MIGIMLIFACALTFALAGTPIVRKLAGTLGFTDQPNQRKLHAAPIPLLGGAAIYVAVLVSVLVFGHHYLGELIGILAGATCMALLGLLDDRIHLSSSLKLGGQILIASGLYFAAIQVRLQFLPMELNFLLTACWIIIITNAINFLDNMDGLSGGITAVAAAFFMVISAINGQFLVGSLAAALFGACAGFLVYNKKPASIFMGDAGSLFIGLMLAILGIKLKFPDNSNFVTWMVPVLVLAVPILDTSLVLLSRTRRGVNPFTTAGKDHISHRLVARGYTQREAVFALYLTGGFFGLAALFVTQASVAEGYTVGGVLLVASLIALWNLEWKQPVTPQPITPAPKLDVELLKTPPPRKPDATPTEQRPREPVNH